MTQNSITGGEALARRLVDQGVTTVFALAGAGHSHLLAALEDLGVTIIGNRHECATVGAADGYARATGKLGVALIIAEQGLPNAVSALNTALHASSPVLVLVTRSPDMWKDANTLYHPELLELATPLTKWARGVPSADRLVEYADAACRAATEGRRGPVVLDFQMEYLASPVPAVPLAPPRVAPGPEAPAAMIADVAAMLASAVRPIIIAGEGAAVPASVAALRRLAGDFGIPVLGLNGGRGMVAEDDVCGWSYYDVQAFVDQADLVIAAGVRFGMWTGFGRPPRFAATARLVQIDVSTEAMSPAFVADTPIAGDPAAVLRQIADALAEAAAPRHDPAWLADAIAPRRARIAELVAAPIADTHPLAMHRSVAARMHADDILAADGANVQVWAQVSLPVRRPGGYMDHLPLGSIGMGLPLAIGAAAALKEEAGRTDAAMREVVLVSGDGGLGFFIGELDTAFRHGLPLRVVVGNDGMWGTEFHGQVKSIGRAVNTRLRRCDYAMVARGFGAAGLTLDDPARIDEVFDGFFAAPCPALLDVVMSDTAGTALNDERVFDKILISIAELDLL